MGFVEGADASSNGRSIPMEKALDDVLVAFKANGEALRMEHGYPVRLVVPGWEGNMWVKCFAELKLQIWPLEAVKKPPNIRMSMRMVWRVNGHDHGR